MNTSIDILNPSQKPDSIIETFGNIILPGTSVFEYGTGKGRQALYLAGKGINMQVQDKNSEFIEILREICVEEHISNISIEKSSEAEDHIPEKDFDAFICIRVLHFLRIHNAQSVIRNMQKYTKEGGYNVLQVFLEQTEHHPEYFFPTLEHIKELYKGWTLILKTEIIASEKTETTNGRIMYQIGILFQKL